MRISFTSFKISIAGAKLSHLVQKDSIWDYGSMVEQARIIFYQVYKAKANENIESVKKQCSSSCFEKIKNETEKLVKSSMLSAPVIKEIAIVDVKPGKNNKPDMFVALIKGIAKDVMGNNTKEFSGQCSFIRQGDWWLLDEIVLKNTFSIFQNYK